MMRLVARACEFVILIILAIIALMCGRSYADEIPIFPSNQGSFPIAINKTWVGSGPSSVNNSYRYTPYTPDVNGCLTIVNNDTVNQNTVSLSVKIASDTTVQASSGNVITVLGTTQPPLSGLFSPGLLQGNSITVFIPSAGAATVFLVFSGGSSASNTSTVSLFLVQTRSSFCAAQGPSLQSGQLNFSQGSFVQGPTIPGTADTTLSFPVQWGYIDSGGIVHKVSGDTVGGIAVTNNTSSTDAVNNANAARFIDSNGVIGQLEVRQNFFDGTNNVGWDRGRSASQVNFTLSSTLDSVFTGMQVTTAPAGWTVNQQGTATQCSATVAASATGKRHVVTACSICVAAGATAQTPIFGNLRDGATGAGTVKAAAALGAVTNTSACWTWTAPMIGTSNTAATCELSAASAATVACSASITGYDQ